jgi:hypothetical protein
MEQIFKGIYGQDFDDDAYAYITEIRSSGASVDSTQINAINTFVKTGKSDGWYSSIKRLYLPIWASAAPNAVDMISRTSGSFVPTVTHSAGYVQGDGTSGYFDFGVTPSALGLTESSESIFALNKAAMLSPANSDYLIGAFDSASQTLFISGAFRGTINRTSGTGNITSSTDPDDGIILLNRQGGVRGLYLRNATGLSTLVETTSIDDGSVPTTNNLWALGVSNLAISRTDELGAYGAGLGLDATDRTNFTLALKNLWETASGLTLS